MNIGNIKSEAISAALQQMPEKFRTKNLAQHSIMQEKHQDFLQENYSGTVGRYLSWLSKQKNAPIQRLQPFTGSNARWAKTGINEMPQNTASPGLSRNLLPITREERSNSKAVRPKHFDALRYMASPEFVRVKELLESYPEIGGVYFRPTDKGITMVDLHFRSPKPRIGIGDDPYLRLGTTMEQLAPSIQGRIEYLKQVRSRQTRPSLENQFEAFLIREAQAHGLRMPAFPERLCFIHSQWRMDASTGVTQLPDLIAVDLPTRSIVLIELKAVSDYSAFGQVERALDAFGRYSSDLLPFFSQLAKIMGRLYCNSELAEIGALQQPKVALVSWPDGRGFPEIHGLEKLLQLEKSTTPEVAENPSRKQPSSKTKSEDTDIGPQSSGDTSFTARMRFHQSWYRARILGVPCGTGPTSNSTSSCGNMLRQEDGALGLNFLNPEIFAVVQKRLAENQGVVEQFRLLHNMLSSQPMCFNLFAPLANNLTLATRLLQTLLGPDEVLEATKVLMEYAPLPPGEYLGDRTAFDAFITYERPQGGLAFIGFETKLTEPFSQKKYDAPLYRHLTELPDSPWPSEAWRKVAEIAHNQLWRGHLLAFAMTHHPQTPYAAGCFALIRHPFDDSCQRVVAGYRQLLKLEDNTFRDISLDTCIDAWDRVAVEDHYHQWLTAFRLRYLDLQASQEEWQSPTSASRHGSANIEKILPLTEYKAHENNAEPATLSLEERVRLSKKARREWTDTSGKDYPEVVMSEADQRSLDIFKAIVVIGIILFILIMVASWSPP